MLPKFAADGFCRANVYCVGVDAREAAHSDAVQALPKAIAEYLVGADQRSDLIPAIGSIKVNFARLDRREGAAVAD